MKKSILTVVLLAVTFALTAQTKKVAVWETKCSDNSITGLQSTIVRGGMETAISNAVGFIGYDRTSFDAIIKEHNFQRSGAVKESDIKRLGEMAGVQYIIVPEASTDGSDFYIIVKMLDVETGEFGIAYDVLCGSSASEIKSACVELGTKLFGGYGIVDGHEYVDFNLPSGTLWATCNVGAETPESFGNYYAWGETGNKLMFNWEHYKYANDTYMKLTKYCTNRSCGNEGFVDGLIALQNGDDAASISWGGNWHMPSKEQWDELLQNTTNKWTVQNGVTGRLFTASNGVSLFLPAVGTHFESVYTGEKVIGLYWSRSLNSVYPFCAWYFDFNSSGCYIRDHSGSGRANGFSIRPVCEK